MEQYEDYKINELFDLLSMLHEEEFPSAALEKRKKSKG